MIISEIQFRETPGGQELSAQVEFESVPDFRRRVWFRSDPGSPPPFFSGDLFFCGFLVPAMALGEDLQIDAPVTPELVEAVQQRMQPVLLRWYPHYRAPTVKTPSSLPEPPPPATGVACTYSGGLDSCYTFFKNRDEITHILHCRGFDRPEKESRAGYEDHIRNVTRQHAEKYGKIFLGMSSNLTEIGSVGVVSSLYRSGRPVDARFQRFVYFASQLVAYAMFYRSEIGKFFIASSSPYERLFQLASSPLLDPSWSVPGLEIRHDGAECDRTGKAEAIFSMEPDALNHLHICHAKGSRGENCNRCEKCIRTRTSLTLVGFKDSDGSLRTPIEPELIRNLDVSEDRYWWNQMLEESKARGNREIRRAIEVALGRRFDPRRARLNLLRTLRISRSQWGRKQIRQEWNRRYRERRARLLTSI